MDTRRIRRTAVYQGPPVRPLSFQPNAPLSEDASLTPANNVISAQMPGSFAPHVGSMAPPAYQQRVQSSEEPSTVVRAPQSRRSPNPFLSTTPNDLPPPLGTARPAIAMPLSPFPRQLADNGHLAAPGRTAVTQTPRYSVPITTGTGVAPYNSPEVSGPANFGPSVSQNDLWEDHPWASPPRSNTETEQQEQRAGNQDQHDRSLARISEEDDLGDLEYTDGHPNSPGTSVTVASVEPVQLEQPLTAGISRVQSGEADYGAAVRNLIAVGQEVENIVNEGNPERYYYTFPTCILQHEYQGSPQNYEVIRERTRHALELARAFMQRDIAADEDLHKFSRSVRIYLKDALQMLSALFHNLFRANNGSIYGFKVDRLIYMDLTAELLRLRKANEEGFTAIGCSMPRLPKWGNDGSIDGYWSANDFEVLAAVYCTEVEAFLHAISFAHSKCAYLPTGSNTSEVSQTSIPVSANNHRMNTARSPIAASARQSSNEEVGHQPGATCVPIDASPAATHSQHTIQEAHDHVVNGVTFASSPRRNSRRPSNLHSTAFGLSAQTTSSNRLQAMFGQTPRGSMTRTRGGGHGGNPPSDDSSDESGDEGRNSRHPGVPSQGQGHRRGDERRQHGTQVAITQPQFDTKLKVDLIPKWDGDVETLARWIFKVNRIAERSNIIHQQLGLLVPTRLTDQAEVWYYSQSPEIRSTIETDWSTLRQAIGEYYMNEGYVKGLKSKANRAKYRQREHEKETPSQYFIRKLELLQLSYNYNDVELIHEIMSGVPESWMSVLSPKTHDTIEDFRVTFKYYEDHLMRLDFQSRQWNNNNPYRLQQRESMKTKNPFKTTETAARVNAVGWSKSTANPPFPKDDGNVSPRATPEKMGGRACRHCGSMNHWDPECKYARKGERRARVNAVRIDEDDVTAQEEYDALYYQEVSEDEGDF